MIPENKQQMQKPNNTNKSVKYMLQKQIFILKDDSIEY